MGVYGGLGVLGVGFRSTKTCSAKAGSRYVYTYIHTHIEAHVYSVIYIYMHAHMCLHKHPVGPSTHVLNTGILT